MASRRARIKKLGAAGCCALLIGAGASFASAESTGAGGSIEERLLQARGSLERMRARAEAVGAELAGVDPRKGELAAQLTANGRSLYRLQRGGLLPMAGGLDALLGHASRMGRLERIVRAQLDEFQRIEKKRDSLRRESGTLVAQIADAEREVATLEQTRVGLAQRASQNMFDAALANAAPAARGERVQYGLSIVGGGPVGERFSAQRGGLALPVSGPSNIQEATRPESGGPGLEFVATPRAAVRAVAAARVAFSDRYGSYGQLIILDHGERYYTVYGGLATVEVQVGDELSKSARLGTAGSEPIYFEVRRGTKTEDARGWLGI